MTAQEALQKGRDTLDTARIAGNPVSFTPSLDASILLSLASGFPKELFLAHPEQSVDFCADTYFQYIARRITGEPVAYITGKKEFWGRDFTVSPEVLIPKQDTEILVERALELIGKEKDAGNRSRVLDACTGSGCIVITLAASFPHSHYTAFDISPGALAIARHNASRLLTPDTEIDFIELDLRTGLPPCPISSDGTYSLITANPPYVPAQVARTLLEDGRNEPLLALDGGEDGLDLVRILAENAIGFLSHGGRILIETGEYNARGGAACLKNNGFTDIQIHTDLEGQDRVIEGVRP